MEKRILILYDACSTDVKTVSEYLSSFRLFSKYKIYYTHACDPQFSISSLEAFDAILIHYSVRLSIQQHLSVKTAAALVQYSGPKLLFIQDEYEKTETARCWIERLNIDIVYTCVPPAYQNEVYPASRFPRVQFKQILTGYVPIDIENLEKFSRPLSARTIDVCYRGRILPYWYGTLGYEKFTIGKKMKKICKIRKIPHDIELDESKRIHGEAWYQFLGNARATLGTESGANVFDFDGEIQVLIEKEMKRNPIISFEMIYDKYLADSERRFKMNQISPRLFESIALHTGLILFEGEYSGILIPGKHYICLQKDFSNVDEVLNLVSDDAYMKTMTDAAYRDIIESQQYHYREFIRMIDQDLEKLFLMRNRDIKCRSELHEIKDGLPITEMPVLRRVHERSLIRLHLRKGFLVIPKQPTYLLIFIAKLMVVSLVRPVVRRLPNSMRKMLMQPRLSSLIQFIYNHH